MNIKLRSKVAGNYLNVMAKFDRDLFEFLKPPDSQMKLIEFGGSKKGDKVHLEIIFPFKSEWISLITDDKITESEAYFVDEGIVLPAILGLWKHKHIVRKINDTTSEIIDDMTFEAGWKNFTFLLYPFIFIAFFPRIKAYKQYFGNNTST